MSSLHKQRNSPYWYAAYRLSNGRRVLKSTKQSDKREARIVLDAWERVEELAGRGTITEARVREIFNQTLERFELAPLSTTSRAEWFAAWLEGKKTLVEPATFASYQQSVNAFLSYLGPERSRHRLETLDERDIVGFQKHLLAGGRAESTVAKIMKYVREPLAIAAKSGKIAHDPFALAPRLKIQSVEKERFSAEQTSALVRAARGTEWEGLIRLGYTTGMRLMDAVSLRYSDIDKTEEVIRFVARKTKNTRGKSKSRQQERGEPPIGLHEDFKEWLEERPIPFHRSARVFPELFERARAGASASKLSADFAQLMARAGIKREVIRQPAGKGGARVYALSFHSFRHGAASAIYNAEIIRQVVCRLTGHTQSGSLDTYLHPDNATARETRKLIPRLPAG